MSTVINATVKYPSREVNTRYGRRANVVLVSDNGEEIRQWGNPDDSVLRALKRDQKVTLVKDSNNKTIIIPVNEASRTYKPENNETKKVLHDKALELLSYYEDIDRLVKHTMKDYKSEDSLRAITTTVFLQTVRSL